MTGWSSLWIGGNWQQKSLMVQDGRAEIALADQGCEPVPGCHWLASESTRSSLGLGFSIPEMGVSIPALPCPPQGLCLGGQ